MDALSERMVIEALQALEQGQSTAEILKRYPQQEDEMRSILETAVALSKVRVAHSLAAQAESRQQMLAQAAALSTSTDQSPVLFPWIRRMTLALGSLLIIFIILLSTLFVASAEALPGDFLYSAKREVEDLRLSLSTNPADSKALQQRFDEERILEIRQLLERGRQAEVSFEGVIELIDGDTWIVSGLQVILTSETEIKGQPISGRYAWVEATTIDGQLMANAITVEFVPEPSPTPEPTAQEAEIATPEVPPSPTPTSPPTPTSTPVPKPATPETPSETTDSPAAPPTETPMISGDDNVDDQGGEVDDDNQGGSENDSDGDDDNDNDDDDNSNDDDGNNNDDDDNENDNDNDDDENDNDDDNDNHDNDNDNDDDDEKDDDNKNSNSEEAKSE
jgi:hypothetical protein